MAHGLRHTEARYAIRSDGDSSEPPVPVIWLYETDLSGQSVTEAIQQQFLHLPDGELACSKRG
jgi:hypothetical protein